MITRDFLLETAVNAHDRYKASAPVGQPHDMDAYREYDMAHRALRWMEDMGLEECAQVGPWGQKTICKGDLVRVPKGTRLWTTHPRYPRNSEGFDKLAGRTFTVTAFSVFDGYLDSHWHSHKVAQACRHQTVRWPGEGGYWFWANTADIELLAN